MTAPKGSRSTPKAKKGSGAPKASKPVLSPPEAPPRVRVGWIDRTNPNRHLEERQKKLYNVHHGKCLVDYASKEAQKTWHRYVVLPNGDQGPAPFRNLAEMREFERRYKVRSE